MSSSEEWENDPETEKLRDALKRVKIELDQVLPDVIRILTPVGSALKEAGKEFAKLCLKKPEKPEKPETGKDGVE